MNTQESTDGTAFHNHKFRLYIHSPVIWRQYVLMVILFPAHCIPRFRERSFSFGVTHGSAQESFLVGFWRLTIGVPRIQTGLAAHKANKLSTCCTI